MENPTIHVTQKPGRIPILFIITAQIIAKHNAVVIFRSRLEIHSIRGNGIGFDCIVETKKTETGALPFSSELTNQWREEESKRANSFYLVEWCGNGSK